MKKGGGVFGHLRALAARQDVIAGCWIGKKEVERPPRADSKSGLGEDVAEAAQERIVRALIRVQRPRHVHERDAIGQRGQFVKFVVKWTCRVAVAQDQHDVRLALGRARREERLEAHGRRAVVRHDGRVAAEERRVAVRLQLLHATRLVGGPLFVEKLIEKGGGSFGRLRALAARQDLIAGFWIGEKEVERPPRVASKSGLGEDVPEAAQERIVRALIRVQAPRHVHERDAIGQRGHFVKFVIKLTCRVAVAQDQDDVRLALGRARREERLEARGRRAVVRHDGRVAAEECRVAVHLQLLQALGPELGLPFVDLGLELGPERVDDVGVLHLAQFAVPIPVIVEMDRAIAVAVDSGECPDITVFDRSPTVCGVGHAQTHAHAIADLGSDVGRLWGFAALYHERSRMDIFRLFTL